MMKTVPVASWGPNYGGRQKDAQGPIPGLCFCYPKLWRGIPRPPNLALKAEATVGSRMAPGETAAFHAEATVRGVGTVDVSLFDKEGHTRMVVRAGPVSCMFAAAP